MVVEADNIVRSGQPQLRARGVISRSSHIGKAPTRQLHSIPIAVSRSGHTNE